MELCSYPCPNKVAKTLYDKEAAIVFPCIERFRECVVVIQNGIRMLDQDGTLIQTAAQGEPDEPVDAEDTGERVIFRTIMPVDKPKNGSFCIHGRIRKKNPDNAAAGTLALQGGISIGNAYSMELSDGTRKGLAYKTVP